MKNLQTSLLTIFSLFLAMTIPVRVNGPPSLGNPEHGLLLLLGSKPSIYIPPATIGQSNVVGHSVTLSLDLVKIASASPSSPGNLGPHIRHLLGSPKRAFVPPSAPNLPTYSLGRPKPKPRGQSVAPSIDSKKKASVKPSSPANPDHHLRRLLGSLERAPLPPSAPNRCMYIPGPLSPKPGGHNAVMFLDSVERAPVRPSSPANLCHGVMHQAGSVKKASFTPSEPIPRTYSPERPVPKPSVHTVDP